MSLAQAVQSERSTEGQGNPWLLAARPRTLAAAIVPVMVGTAFAAQIGEWQAIPAALCLIFALLIQIGTNYANDYFDFLKGADTAERLGPTRVTSAGLVSIKSMRRAIGVVFGLAFLIGLNLIFYGGWWLVIVGAFSILFGLAYTGGPFPLAYNSLGDLFVFVFFGLIAVGFTFYVQAGYFMPEVWLGGAAVGALATNILVINNLRDCETDAKAGKKTLVVRLGKPFSHIQFGAAFLLAGGVPLLLLIRGAGFSVLLPWILAPLALRIFFRVRTAESGEVYNQLLGKMGAFLILYGLFFSIGILVS